MLQLCSHCCGCGRGRRWTKLAHPSASAALEEGGDGSMVSCAWFWVLWANGNMVPMRLGALLQLLNAAPGGGAAVERAGGARRGRVMCVVSCLVGECAGMGRGGGGWLWAPGGEVQGVRGLKCVRNRQLGCRGGSVSVQERGQAWKVIW